MKSNEEILDGLPHESPFGIKVYQNSVLEKAMDEARRESAIGFVEWMQRYTLYEINPIYKFCVRQQPNGGRGKTETFTASELYNLYLNSINKAP